MRQPPDQQACGSLTTMYPFVLGRFVPAGIETSWFGESESLPPSHIRSRVCRVVPGIGRRLASSAARMLAVGAVAMLVGCGVDGTPSAGGQGPTAGGEGQTALASSASTADPSTADSATSSPTPSVAALRYETVTTMEPIPFPTETVDDPAQAAGRTQITTAGVAGKARLTYEVELRGDEETGRRLVSREVISRPVTQVTTVGSKVEPEPPQEQSCDPNYTGRCVPIATDVDCAGGSGNGPAYVRGPVTVVGSDIYGLDRDKDGVGCE